MAKTAIYSGRTFSAGSGITRHRNIGIGQASISSGTLAAGDTINKVRAAGTYSNLLCRQPTNATTSPSTYNFLSAVSISADTTGNQNLSITTGTPGEYEDVTNNDAVVAGAIINVRDINGGGGSFTEGLAGVCFTATVNTSAWYGGFNTGPGAGGAKNYHRMGTNNSSLTESAALQQKMLTAGTFKYGCYSQNLDGTGKFANFGLSINGSAGNILVAVSNPAAGSQIEDATNTDAVVVNDLVSRTAVRNGGTLNMLGLFLVVFETTDGSQMTMVHGTGGADPSFNAGTTSYLPINGQLQNTVTTESDVKTKAAVAKTVSLASAYVSADTATLGSTINFRVNGANGNQSISVPLLSAAGWYQDVTNTDALVSTDETDWQVNVGTGGSMSLSMVAAKEKMPVTYTQSLTGSLSTSGALTKAGSQAKSGSITPSGALAKLDSRPMTGGTLTLTEAVIVNLKATLQSLTGGITLTEATATKAVSKSLTDAITPSGVYTKSITRPSLTGAITLAGASVVNASAKGLTGAMTLTGTLAKAVAKPLTGGIALGGALAKSWLKGAFSGGFALGSSTVVNQARKGLTGTLTTGGTLAKSVLKSFADAIAFSAVFTATKAGQTLSFAGGITMTGATLVKQTAKPFAGGMATSAALFKDTLKSLSDAMTLSGSLSSIRTQVKSFAGSFTLTSSTVVKSMGKVLTGTITPTGAQSRLTMKSIVGSIVTGGSLAKGLLKSLAGSLGLSGVWNYVALQIAGPPITYDNVNFSYTVNDAVDFE